MENSSSGSDLNLLLEKYANNTCSKAELEQLVNLAQKDSNGLFESLKWRWSQAEPQAAWHGSKPDEMFHSIMETAKLNELLVAEPDKEEAPVHKIGNRRWVSRLAVAASILIVFSATLLVLFKKDGNNVAKISESKEVPQDVAPGGDRAVLLLANGEQIILDSASNGNIAHQGGIKIIKLGGRLNYITETASTEVLYNTITTPKGGQYQLELSDGSKVWLNAASSLRFPTAFPGAERKVELTGEGYFEVEENPTKPFIVSSLPSVAGGRGVEVKVLGTHFNVNSYDDELSIKVSLIKGSVQVAKLNNENVTNPSVKEIDTKILSPGEQAELSDAKPLRVNDNVDMDDVLAWKNGYLSFNNADLQSVMRQLARWYDVEVLYEGALPKRKFEGKMPRNSNLSEVLKVIETNNVHMKIQGKKIVVNP